MTDPLAIRAADAILAAAAALALTACQPYTSDATTAQEACERLVAPDPDAATFEHLTTTQEDDRWTVSGVVTIGASVDQYKCSVELHDGEDPTGHVYYVTE